MKYLGTITDDKDLVTKEYVDDAASSTYHVATYSNKNGNNDGKYYKISINSYTAWMLAFRICAYHQYESYEFEISGYNYGSSYWYSPAAMMVTSSYTRTIDVSFGYDSKWHLWVAFPAFQYSGVSVSLKANGYYQVEDEKSLFTIELVDGLPETVQVTKSCSRPWYRNETVSNAGNANTVNNHTVNSDVPANAKFTDTVTTATTTGSGNAVTAITASNGALTVTKGSTFLTSHQTLYESKINWGNTGVTGGVTPMGASLSSEHSANRIAYLNPAAIQIEYTTNGGSSWADSGYTDTEKTWLCTGNQNIAIGQSKSGYSQYTALTTNHWTRITLTGQNGTTGYVYTSPRKLLVNMSTALVVECLVEYKTGASGASWQTFGTYTVSGWSGWNDIPLVLSSFGGGTTQTGNNWYLRFTFKISSTRTDNYKGMAFVLGLRLFGATDWMSASSSNSKGPFSSTGHLYSYDVGANATFPAKVTATSFSGPLTGNVTGTATGNLTSVQYDSSNAKLTYTKNGSNTDIVTVATLKSALGSMPASDVYSWAKASTKPSYTASEVGALSTETDPVFTASAAHGISSTDISNWNGKSTVSLDRKTTSGTNIADLTINGTTTKLYAPTGGGGSGTITKVKTTAGAHTAIDVSSGAANFNVPTKTSHLTNDSGFTNNTGTITGVTAGTGLSGGGTSGSVTLNHSNSITAGTIGSSSASQGSTVAIPYATYDSNGHITGKGTHTHTITGFLTAETDPTVPSWAKASTKPTYTASEVGALPDTTTIPTKTSDLTNDSGFISGTGFFKIVEVSVSVASVSAHQQSNLGEQTVPSADRPSGMTLVGIVGYKCNNYRIVPYNFYVTENHKFTLAMVNTTAAASSAATFTAKLLYAKVTSA